MSPSFICNCRVGLHTVEGIGYIQLEHRGLHHINSSVGANNELNDGEPQELEDGSNDEDDLESWDDKESNDEDDEPEDADESISADDGL